MTESGIFRRKHNKPNDDQRAVEGLNEAVLNRAESIVEVFYENEGPLKAFISRFMYRPQDVDDIAQETFIRAFKAEKKSIIEYPKAYLYRVARNLALKELTKKSNKMTSFIEDSCSPEVLGSDEDVEKQVETLEKLSRVKTAIAELPPQCQRVFIMRKVYGFSHKEISHKLGISVSTVEKHIVSGLKRCRLSVNQQEKARDTTLQKITFQTPDKKRR